MKVLSRLSTFLGTLALAVTGGAAAQSDLYTEKGKLIRAPEAVSALGPDLFGDKVNLYSGGIEFVQTDVSLPGNNALEVRVGRRFRANWEGFTSGTFQKGLFDDWDLDIPNIHGVFAHNGNHQQEGWMNEFVALPNDPHYGDIVFQTTQRKKRCELYSQPPQALTVKTSTAANWDATEFWHGTNLYVPGVGDQEILINATNPRPTGTGLATGTTAPAAPLGTKSGWAVAGCIPLAAGSNDTGDGFLVVSPEGTKYFFNQLVYREYSSLNKSYAAGSGGFAATTGTTPGNGNGSKTPQPTYAVGPSSGGSYNLPRQEGVLLPTRIEDRFGNFVTYNYTDPIDPWRVVSIMASDSRSLTFGYSPNQAQDGTRRITSVSDGTRTWNYAYTGVAGAYNSGLSSISQQDGSQWLFNLAGLRSGNIQYSSLSNCDLTTNGGSAGIIGISGLQYLIGTMTHPSGAKGTFRVTPTEHGRSNVPPGCVPIGDAAIADRATTTYVLTFSGYSLADKRIAGPGLTTDLVWTYDYGPGMWTAQPRPDGNWGLVAGRDYSHDSIAYPGYCAANACPGTKVVEVTDPDQNHTKYTFGTQFDVNDGQLKKIEVYQGNGTLLRTTQLHNRDKLPDPTTTPYPDRAGTSLQGRGDGDMASYYTPEDQRIITQQAIDFKWIAAAGGAGFDGSARPTMVTKSSVAGTTVLQSRTDTTLYADNTDKWVMGQVKTITNNDTNKEVLRNVYNASTANLEEVWHFGKKDQSMTYNADGTLLTKADGLGQATTYSNYKLGIAQGVSYADGKTESAVVNSIGLITSVTDAVAQTTNYGYDAMGRLNFITRPNEAGLTYNATSLNFERLTSGEYGLGGNVGDIHWRQTVTTGNAQTIQYYDALWRPLLTRTFDSADEANTRRVVLRKYDFGGRTTFESYPQRNNLNIGDAPVGITNAYDTLGRATQKLAVSELGALTTSFGFPAYAASDLGPKKTTTDPRGNISTTTFQAFDEPREDSPVAIAAPQGVSVSINRDLFGKPASITRGGSDGGFTVSVTRSYVYDANERLCKTVEPEVGATIQAYDLANNVSWRATGLSFTGTSSCDQASVLGAQKTSFLFDARNRLLNTSFGDGSPAIARTYHNDGLLKDISVGTSNAPGSSAWSYTYNNRRLLKTESLTTVAPQ